MQTIKQLAALVLAMAIIGSPIAQASSMDLSGVNLNDATYMDLTNVNLHGGTSMDLSGTSFNQMTTMDLSNVSFGSSNNVDFSYLASPYAMFDLSNVSLNGSSMDLSGVNLNGGSSMNLSGTNFNGSTSMDLSNVDLNGGNSMNLSGTNLNGSTSMNLSNVDLTGGTSMNLSNVDLTGGTSMNLSNVDLTGGTSMNLSNVDLTGGTSMNLSNVDLTGGSSMDLSNVDLNGGTSMDLSNVDLDIGNDTYMDLTTIIPECNDNHYNVDYHFPDSYGHWGQDYICYLHKLGAVSGYLAGADLGYFRPDRSVTRAEFLKTAMALLEVDVRGLNSSSYSYAHFTDVEDNAWYTNYVMKAYEMGIVEGYYVASGNEFRPHAPITRAEAAKIIVTLFASSNPAVLDNELDRISDKLEYSSYTSPFTDVNMYDWFYIYVVLLQEMDIVDGKHDGLYHPSDYLTRAEMSKVIWNSYTGEGFKN